MMRTAIDHLNIIETARMWNDQSYCWYGDGFEWCRLVPVAAPNVAVMVGAALTAGMDGVPT